jgi:TRAP-type transport system small permease protein
MTDEEAPREGVGTKLLGYISSAMIAVVAVLLIIQIAGRYAFRNPPDWTEELARVAFVYATFFGAALAIAKRAHLGVDLLATILPARLRALKQIVSSLIAIVSLVIVSFYGFVMVNRLSGQSLTSVPVSKGVMFAAVPIGCVLMALYELGRLKRGVGNLGARVDNRTASLPEQVSDSLPLA